MPVMNPASDYCQRWSKGTHSWRHRSEGGFDPRLYDVVPLVEKTARAFVVDEHYAASFPAARFSIGLLTRDDRYPINGAIVDGMALVGVATFSTPMSSRVLTSVFPTLAPYEESVELGRFVLTDTPANAESWFLARAFRLAHERGIRGVVSFADPMPRHRRVTEALEDGTLAERVEEVASGHCGTIYQSVGARALGRSTARTLHYDPRRGVVLSERTLSKIRCGESGSEAAEKHLVSLGAPVRHAGQDVKVWLREALDAIGIVRRRHPGNFRYAFALGSAAARRRLPIVGDVTPYPKASTDRLPALIF